MTALLVYFPAATVAALFFLCFERLLALIFFSLFLLTSDVEGTSGKQLCGGNQTAIEKMLRFGRELQAMSQHLRRQFGHSDTNKKAIQVLMGWGSFFFASFFMLCVEEEVLVETFVFCIQISLIMPSKV